MALGGAPNRERERARASRERDSGRGRLRGAARGLGEEAGGGARGGVAVSVLLAGRKTTGGVEMGWAGQVGLVGCRGKSR